MNINGKSIYHWTEKEQGYGVFGESIKLDHVKDEITFKMLTKPASEGGDLNRCQLTDLITVAREMLTYLNAKFPCEENKITLEHLRYALESQERRTKDRSSRGVEGKSEK